MEAHVLFFLDTCWIELLILDQFFHSLKGLI
jgi:hypothetical protein